MGQTVRVYFKVWPSENYLNNLRVSSDCSCHTIDETLRYINEAHISIDGKK